ncbi:MAG: VWA domain-containing protein, partial [Clostridia bacterium]
MSLTNKDFNEIVSGVSELEKGIWHKDSYKKYLFSVFSDSENDIVDTVNNKIILTPNDESSLNVATFSDKNIISSTNIKIEENEYGEEYLKLELEDRIVTIIIDQSGSMTWNDANGSRHVIAKNLVESINSSYPGDIKYNLLKYGSKYINTLFFGLIDENISDINSIDDLNDLYFSDSNSDFSKIRIVRNVERLEDGEILTFPTSPSDGTIISDGFLSSVFEENLTSGVTYYYKIYSYNNFYNFSDGIEIAVTPKERVIPRGVSIFRSFEDNDILQEGTAIVGTGVKRDENTVGIWNFNEGQGNYLFDFGYNKINLSISDDSPRWINSDFVPAG